MVDERIQALIHAELDGELDAAGRAELERAAAGSPAVHKLRQDLQAIEAALGRMPAVPVPGDLRGRILGALDEGGSTRPNPYAGPAVGGKVVVLDAARNRRRELTKVGFALAAGVALGAIGLSFVQPHPEAVDPADLGGTMVRRAQGDETQAGAVRIDTPAVRGAATLFEADGVMILQFDLQSTEPVAVNADYGQAGLSLMGFAQGSVQTPDIRSSQGAVSYLSRGEQRFVVYLARSNPKGGVVRLKFERGGEVVHQAALTVPGPQGAAGR